MLWDMFKNIFSRLNNKDNQKKGYRRHGEGFIPLQINISFNCSNSNFTYMYRCRFE